MDLGDGRNLEIFIKTSARARRLRLVSGLEGVHAVVPHNFDPDELLQFVSSKQDWLIRTSRYYEKVRQQCGGFQPGTLFYKGVRFFTAIVGDRRFSVTVSDALKTITFHVPDRRKVKRYQQEWYRQETGIMIAKRLPEIAECMQLHYNRVSVKKQKSRWGSCSRKGNLNFNLLLAAAPPAVVDYVIVHELAHLRVLNHSPQFWAHVQSVDPEYKSHREWLSTFAPLIRID